MEIITIIVAVVAAGSILYLSSKKKSSSDCSTEKGCSGCAADGCDTPPGR